MADQYDDDFGLNDHAATHIQMNTPSNDIEQGMGGVYYNNNNNYAGHQHQQQQQQRNIDQYGQQRNTQQLKNRHPHNLRKGSNQARYLAPADTATSSIWRTLSNALTGEEYVERAKSYYEFMAGVSGLLAGFTYITTSQEPHFDDEMQETVHGIVGVTGFVTALISTVVSIILWVALTILGPECAIYFGNKFSKFHNIPAIFTILSLILMSTSIMISIQGYYNYYTSAYSYILIGSSMVTMFVLYIYVKKSSSNYVKKYWKTHQSKRILDGV